MAAGDPPSPTSQPVKVPKAAAIVATSLRRRIVLGELAEGTPLPNETELMRYYQVSRPTLREALRILENESLIVVKRGARGGARVAHPDPGVAARHAALLLYMQGTTIRDVFEARLIIEPAAVAVLAERARVDPSVLDPLRDVHREALANRHDLERYASLAARFHELVVELSGNKTLALIALVLLEIVEPHNQATFARIDNQQEVVSTAEDDHLELLEILESGQGDAEAVWRRHMLSAQRRAFDALGAESQIEFIDSST
jgi:GntR family transcriptional repressor for pyruvate dehydrogenase complex